MIVIPVHAEEMLISVLKTARAAADAHRCIYIRSSLLSKEMLVDLPALSCRFIEDERGYYFICQDGDVFIVAEKIPFRSFATLKETLEGAGAVAIADLLDVQKDWVRLITLAEEKASRLAAAEAEMQKKKAQAEKDILRERTLSLAPDAAKMQAVQKLRLSREGISVMIIEDDIFTGKLVSGALSTQFSVSAAETGAEALRRYAAIAPDVVFLDIELPDVSGHDILKKLLEVDPQAFVVMLSGNGNRENIMRAVNMGAKGFIGKPFTKEKLFQYIGKCPKLETEKAGA